MKINISIIFFLLFYSCIGNIDNVLIDSGYINTDSLACFRIEKKEIGYAAFIDNKSCKKDSAEKMIIIACGKRENDTVLLLKYNVDSIPENLVDDILLTARRAGKKVILQTE